MNIRRTLDGSEILSNYRLLSEPVKLKARTGLHYVVPSGDGYEPSDPVEVEVDYRKRTYMNLRGSRKQRAARAMVPRESIKIVKIGEPVAPPVAMAILAGKSAEEIKVVSLETEIQRLWGIVRAPEVAKQKKRESLDKLEQLFAGRRI